ncbi:MAG: hypothetical protein JSR80_05660 [Verrucomicrobia bacterium]|nr:hypothetical protein [Verrucomicrobiota bacterium]
MENHPVNADAPKTRFFSPWSLAAMGFLTAGCSAFLATKIYSPQWHARYRLPLIGGTIGGTSASVIAHTLFNPASTSTKPPDKEEKKEEEEEQTYISVPEQVQQFISSLKANPQEFETLKSNASSEAVVVEALDVLVKGQEGQEFWQSVRGSEIDTLTPLAISVFQSMLPAAAARLLDIYPQDLNLLIPHREDALTVMRLVTTDRAMDRWIALKKDPTLSSPEEKNQIDLEVKELFQAMKVPLPELDPLGSDESHVWQQWETKITPAFRRLVKESYRFVGIKPIQNSSDLLLVQIALGDFPMECLTDMVVLKKINDPEQTPKTKEVTARINISIPDDLKRTQGIVTSTLQLLESENQEALVSYLRVTQKFWPTATLYALDRIALEAAQKNKTLIVNACMKEVYKNFTYHSHQNFADLLFGKGIALNYLPGLARTLTRLGVDFSTPELRTALINTFIQKQGKNKEPSTIVSEFLPYLSPNQCEIFNKDFNKKITAWVEAFDNWMVWYPKQKQTVKQELFQLLEIQGSKLSFGQLSMEYFGKLDLGEREDFLEKLKNSQTTLFKHLRDLNQKSQEKKIPSLNSLLTLAAFSQAAKTAQPKESDRATWKEWAV